jgi:hypothetical protein
MLQVGKRYQCEACGTEALVTKPSGDGELQCCGATMALLQPKKTKSAD